jgi:hemoglobin-like flavoprotein
MTLTHLAPAPEPVVDSGSQTLSQEQKRLVRDSFTRIEPAADLVARLFYLKSVDLDPSIRDVLKAPSRAQRRKFMAAMKLAVISLDRLEQLQPMIRLLGIRQRQEGIKSRHYTTFRRAWVWTLEQSLEARFSREAREAWTALLGEMARAKAA